MVYEWDNNEAAMIIERDMPQNHDDELDTFLSEFKDDDDRRQVRSWSQVDILVLKNFVWPYTGREKRRESCWWSALQPPSPTR